MYTIVDEWGRATHQPPQPVRNSTNLALKGCWWHAKVVGSISALLYFDEMKHYHLDIRTILCDRSCFWLIFSQLWFPQSIQRKISWGLSTYGTYLLNPQDLKNFLCMRNVLSEVTRGNKTLSHQGYVQVVIYVVLRPWQSICALFLIIWCVGTEYRPK